MFDPFLRSRGAPPHEPSRVVGLDVGERRTRVVVAEGGASAMRVVFWSDEPTPPGLIVAGRAVRAADLVPWIRRTLSGAGAADHVWTACPSSDVQVKRLQVPDAANREATLRGLAVNPAFRAAGGESPAAWRHDYHVVDAATGAVMAVAVRPEAVRSAIASAAGAGGRVRGVSVAECAAVHAWLGTAPHPEGRSVLLEAGHNGVTLIVMDGGQPVGFRRVMYGGKVLSERGGWFPPAEIPPPLVEEWCARIVQEVRMLSGAVFRGGAEPIPPVVFMGGLGAAKELAEALGRMLAVEVDAWSAPGAGTGTGGGGGEAGELGSGMAVAFGLARQGLAHASGGGGPLIQLQRPEDAVEGRQPEARPSALARDRRVRLALAACLVSAAACGGAEAWLRLSSRRAAEALAVAQADSARAKADIARLGRLAKERARLGGDAETIDRLARGRRATPRLMERLARAIPTHAWVDSLSVEPGADAGAASFRISGYAGTAGQVAAIERGIIGDPVKEVTVLSLAPATIADLAVVRWTMVGRLEAAMPVSGVAGYRPQDSDTTGGGR